MRQIEVVTEKWSLTLDVDTCERCYWGAAFWRASLWQNPTSGKVHKVTTYRDTKTECGLALPTPMVAHRVSATVNA